MESQNRRQVNATGGKMIDRHLSKIIVFFLVVFAVELGIGAWRLPKEFRSSIIPKLDQQVSACKICANDTEFIHNHTHRYYDGKPNENK